MKASSVLVLGTGADDAARRVAEEALEGLDGAPPALVTVFISPHHAARAQDILDQLRDVLGAVPLIGCVAGSVIGGTHEVEDGPAISLWLASGTGPVETFAMDYLATPSGGLFAGHRFEAGGGAYLMVGDPFTFPVGQLLEHLNQNVPGARVIGGMASGAAEAGQSWLFFDDQVLTKGAVGARLAGAPVDLLVSQGCRPIGRPFTVTRAEGNVIHELGGRPPFQRLQDLVLSLPEADRRLLANGGLQVGLVVDEYRHEQRRGDFLVRNVVGADASTGAIAVGGEVELGQTVQFHVRDAASADEDLRETLERELAELKGHPPAGALLFSCNGRGKHFFSEPDHDAALVAKLCGDIPVAGFFCAGEIGPIGDRNFVHGFTASLALFR
jgi:small ligand-binding sensory domain FIST